MAHHVKASSSWVHYYFLFMYYSENLLKNHNNGFLFIILQEN